MGEMPTTQSEVPIYPFVDSPSYEDGIFLPGSTYQELHATLRNHVIHAARSEYPSRRGSLVDTGYQQWPDSHFEEQDLAELDQGASTILELKIPGCTVRNLEYILWKNYIEEMASWVDKFDNARHFQYVLPTLAKTNPHLRYSMLALSARQMERFRPGNTSFGSLELYQEAIHLLLPELQTRSIAVIASCVVLCVLEMMSCSPKAWRRHLDGCATLLQAVGINGFSGGLGQALFWCFARMDVCGALISSDRTLIPVSYWASKTGDLQHDLKLFPNPKKFDMHANQAVYLLAQVCTLFKECGPWSKEPMMASPEYTSRWHALFSAIQKWFDDRPPEMRPILSRPADPASLDQPFATMLFANGPAISGNQLYHTAALLMLQNRPVAKGETAGQKTVLWHARKICAISMSNTHHGCWTNSVQPLWLAGKSMSHPTEHRAILEVLGKIERETGWGTEWRRDDLRAYWGELED